MSLGSCVAVAWGHPLGLIPLLVSILMGYCFGSIIGKHGRKSLLSKLLLCVCIVTQLAQTIVFCTLYNSGAEIFAAFGCGVFSLHTISLCFDTYRGDVLPDRNIFNVIAYIGFLPSLCGIPVVNYKKISEQLKTPEIKSDKLADGILLMLFGIAEKVIISDRLTELFNEMQMTSAESMSMIMAWIGAFIFACSLYSKLKGYSNIARGFAMMLGFDIPASFRYPISRITLREYVNSYNVSAATFAREYIHRPIEGRHSSHARTLNASFVSIIVLCISYCPSVRFAIWGLIAAILVMIEMMLDEKLSRIPKPVRFIFTHMLTLSGWAFVSQSSTSASIEYLTNMFGSVRAIDYAPLQYFILSALPYLILMLIFDFKPLHEYYNKLDNSEMSIVIVLKPFTTFILLLLCTVFLMSGTVSYTGIGIGGV